jgi:RimJ/RimL family protein N-acetyltransferase
MSDLHMPVLETPRASVRPLAPADLDAVSRLWRELGWAEPDASGQDAGRGVAHWLAWQSAAYGQLERLGQPPYGDRAIALLETGAVVGLLGLVPSFDAFARLPAFGGRPDARRSAEFGLFWALAPGHRGVGLATETARVLVDFAFSVLRVERLVATTEHDNEASIGVMRRLGMRIERNEVGEPRTLQVVGVLEAPP